MKQEDDFFWEAIDRGEFVAQKCAGCGVVRHPPSPYCAACHSPQWENVALSGRGTIHTWIVSRHPSQDDPAPRVVILVDLEEGLRFVSTLLDPEHARIGAAVALEYADVDGKRLPLFRTTDRSEKKQNQS